MTRRDWWSLVVTVLAIVGFFWGAQWLQARTERRHEALTASTCHDLKAAALRFNIDRCHEIVGALIERIDYLP